MTCLHDEPGPDGEHLLAVFADGLRRDFALGPPPRVGPALAGVLAAGIRTAAAGGPVSAAVPGRGAGGFLGRLQGRRPRLVLGAAAASLTFLGMGSAGALPGPAQSAFDRSVDAVGISLPAAGARESTSSDVHDTDELPATFRSDPQDEAGAGTHPSGPVPPAGGRQGAVAPGGAAATDASASAATGPGDVDVPGGDAGGRARQPHVEHPAAEDRPTPGPERGTHPEERGGPPSGVGPEVATGAERRPGVGFERSSKWHRPSWGFAREEPTEPAAGPGLGQEAGQSAERPPERAYPSRPSRR